MEDIKESIGDGIIDLESTLTKIRLRRNAIIKVERELEKELETEARAHNETSKSDE